MKMEQWKHIEGFEGYYEVSSFGRVRRTARGPGTRPGLVLKPLYDKDGYARQIISRDNKAKTVRVHQVVIRAFVGDIPAGMVVNHKNGVKDDNRVENLEVVTIAENTAHGFRVLGRRPVKNPRPGEKNGRAKITENDVHEVFRLRALGLSQQKIADIIGIYQTGISSILLGKTWACVSRTD